MNCPKCQTENPETRKFCRECGARLILLCPQCSSENLPGDKFCGECGHNLVTPSGPQPKDLSFDEKIDKIQRYLPKGLTEKILSQRDKIEGERKQVTVMFCDMEGFTQLTERLGPEEAYTIMDQVYEILIHKVHDYEGTVNEMTGDGIMALFGAPITLEDAPQRAIRSAHAIHREMTKFSDKIKQQKEGTSALRMRIGIHTGPVVVGTLGNDLRVDFKAVGDTVNLASRMEGLAEPGSTYVTEESFKLTEGFFRFEALGEKEIKGKEQPIRVYRVIAPSTRRTRFDVSAERGLTPLVGRGRELELLLDGFERSKHGQGQAFSIIAEAGLGKSRLLYEFRKAVANEDVTFLEGKCLSYSRGIAYHPLKELLKSTFDIRESDPGDQIKKKVKTGLKTLGVDEGSTLPYLLELLSVKDSGIDKIPMSPEARKDRMIEAMIRISVKGSGIKPLIMAIEDLHWIDKSSEDALKYVLESISGARILLIFTYRPEFVHTWGGRSYHNQVNLNRLSNRESLVMAAYLLGADHLESNLENLILGKTEGVPLFIEEFIKTLKDLRFIDRKGDKYYVIKDVQDLSIPPTIQDVIMARVDSLPNQAKELLQTASAIEREFSYDLIRRVTGLSETELLSNLSALKDSELLFERGIFPESNFIFKHAVTREVVYDSILARRKRKLHGNIGNAIEELYKHNIEEQYGILAEHYIVSENYEKAAECCRLAARKAEKAASFVDATVYGEKWVNCLEKLSPTAEVERKVIDARTTLGFYKIQLQHYADGKRVIEPIVELTLKHDYKRRLPQIYTLLGINCYYVEEDLPKAIEYLENAIKMAEETNNLIAYILSNHYLGHVLADECEFQKGRQHIQKALEIVQKVNTLWSIAMHKACIAFTIYYQQGKIDLAYRTSHEGLRLAEESGDIFSKTEAHVNHGVCCYGKGYLDEAEEHLIKGTNLGERSNLPAHIFVANLYLGEIYCWREDYQEAQNCYNKAISIIDKYGMFGSSFVNLGRIAVAYSKIMNNEKNIDLKSLYSYAYQNKKRFITGTIKRYVGEILLNIDEKHVAEAEKWIIEAMEADKRHGMMFELGMDNAVYADLFKRKGDESRAKEILGKAIETFRECGADGWAAKYEKDLAALL